VAQGKFEKYSAFGHSYSLLHQNNHGDWTFRIGY
jgi:hypothetical protein